MKAQKVSILGLGRTGASVGLALKTVKAGLEVIGYDEDNETMRTAQKLGAVDRTQWRLIQAVSEADILVLAVGATQLEKLLRTIGRDVQAHALVLDMSGVKAQGLQWAERYLRQGHYVGVSPVWAADKLLEPDHTVAGARPDLFKNSVYCLMPAATAEPKAVETAVNLGLLLGAQPFFLDPAEYDSLARGVQTLPGLAAAALFQAITKANGWRDMLRFAQAPFALATLPLQEHEDVAAQAFADREAMLRWLDAYLAEVQEIRRWVATGDLERLAALLQQLDLERERWLAERKENDWQETNLGEYRPPGFVEQMLGSQLSRATKTKGKGS